MFNKTQANNIMTFLKNHDCIFRKHNGEDRISPTKTKQNKKSQECRAYNCDGRGFYI